MRAADYCTTESRIREAGVVISVRMQCLLDGLVTVLVLACCCLNPDQQGGVPVAACEEGVVSKV